MISKKNREEKKPINKLNTVKIKTKSGLGDINETYQGYKQQKQVSKSDNF